ncbi:MAG: hypothetical protein EA420_04560 [Candidatus Competibacteraceae bacterium]|nr:MAG: hypothetical protein EA420_04560 [Candidatus Competibacteraceae bacterium]
MDRAPLGAGAPWSSASPPSSEWVRERVEAYWRVLGVTDPGQIAALTEQTLRRAPEGPETAGPDPVARALVAARNLLDDWLARTLDLPQQPRALAAARATLLGGVAPDWPSALFAAPGEADEVRDVLRAAIAEPTPPPAPGAMPAQPIELFSLRGLLRRWWRSMVGS